MVISQKDQNIFKSLYIRYVIGNFMINYNFLVFLVMIML